MSSVSIVTITQLSRRECLLNLYELIKLQTYSNIIEWIIVEGSQLHKHAIINAIYINRLIEKNKEEIQEDIKEEIQENTSKDSQEKTNKMNIIYCEYSGQKLSDLRNLGNNTCKGDIIVCMDDDDYYPIERVSHAVIRLNKSKKQIAGCSDMYMYHYSNDKLYKFKQFHKNHSTNNCMAFKKEYLKTHAHESGLEKSEEKSFTNNFSEPMIQLDAKKCIIVSSHNHNTFDKRQLIHIQNTQLYEVQNINIYYYIPEEIFRSMRSAFITYDYKSAFQ